MKAILFDWDGTLADSIGRLFEANIAVMTSFGLPFDEDVYRRHFSPDWRLMYERLGIPAERIDEANDIWLAAYRSGATTALLAGARDALERLSGAGFRLGLVTAGHRDIVEPLLGRFELAGFFDVAVFGTDMVEQKPDPTPLLVAISRLGGVTAEEAVYLGDTVEDIAMASAAGVRAVGIPSLVGPADALLAAGADEIASSVASWADALLAAMPQ
ncbi:MAG TPA: HAD family hydrolase [Candidatus Limnocylindrales bacterium]